MRFGRTTAVDHLDLMVHEGEFLVLVGPSGCGKTTALRMVAGLESPTEGRVLLGDRDVTHDHPRDRDVAMVFQNYALYPHLDVRRNLGFPLRQRKVQAAEIARRVDDVASVLELGPLLDRLPKQLSGGQRQRVALGRAMVRQPAVFLMDEPLSNLDAQLRLRARAELASLHRRLGTTVIYVTHDQVEAMTMGQRIAVMRDGVLQQVAAPHELYRSPANLFVATFIGTPTMGLLTGRLDGEHLHGSGWSLPIASALAARAAAGADVVLGLRPEHVERAIGDRADLVGTVSLVEPIGSDVYASVAVDADTVRARLHPDDHPLVGDTIALSLRLDAAHLFDAVTGVRL
jgi:multiple sugar transport system ATP-binding protein